MKNYILLMRSYQWSKNLFIFAPAFFGFSEFDMAESFALLGSFIAFCLLASSIYVVNDIVDVKADRTHPKKRFRPIARGAITMPKARIFAIMLAALSLLMLLFIALGKYQMGGGIYDLNPQNLADFALFFLSFAFPFLFYVILNLAYSFSLKHIAILDIFIIASGFVIRLFVGSNATNIPLSHWIIITTFLLALFLALAKRRDEVMLDSSTSPKYASYNRTFLDIAMSISASLVMVAYIFYSIDLGVNSRFGTHNLYLTSVFVLLGIFRYMQLTFVKNDSGDPARILLKDRFLQCSILAWFVSFVAIVVIKF